MYLAWHDPSKTPTTDKIEQAINRYRDKFGGSPAVVLLNPDHAGEIPEDWTVVEVRTRSFIPRHTFYVGVPEPEPAEGDWL
jgi:hypothetical protein